MSPMENGSAPRRGRAWLAYLAVLGVIVGVIVALNVAGIRVRTEAPETRGRQPTQAIVTGDYFVRLAIVTPRDREARAREAIDYYSRAIPWPAAYRRIGVARETLLDESGARELSQLDSPNATRGLTGEDVRRLSEEVDMWRDIYGPTRITPAQAEQFASRIEELNLGPLRQFAIADAYARAGETARAGAARRAASDEAMRTVASLVALMLVLVLGGLAGIVIGIRFVSRYAGELRHAERPRIQPSVLLLSFIAYLVSYLVIGGMAGLAAAAAGLDVEEGAGAVGYLLLQIMAILGAGAVALLVLRRITSLTREDPREIGLNAGPIGQMIKWGVGGYFAALPLMGIAVLISQQLQQVFFREIETPEHPIVPLIARGGAVFVVAFVMAVVVAPIVEEIAFRGMLYNSLRGQMGVWAASLLSAAIFAVVHPTLPGGFLPILALGAVLALLREKTGSLAPPIIAHGLNNALMLLLARLYY